MPRPSRPTADELFQRELTERGLSFAIEESGIYRIEIGTVTASVSLDNIRRNYVRDKDPEAIARFAEQLKADFFGEIPDWKTAKRGVRFSLEPSDYASGFQDTLHDVLTDNLVKVFVVTPPDGSRISWISNSMVSKWGTTPDAVRREAAKNMDKLASETVLEIDDVDGVKLGMLSTTDTPFKASLILTKKFRSIVKPVLGWPVLAVAPARDFVFVLSLEDRGFLGRLGKVVLREFKESGHPITAEVLEVGDHGIKAIGSFAPRNQ